MNLFIRNPNILSSRHRSNVSSRWDCEELNSIYEVKEKMGEGCFGTVHKVRSRIRNRRGGLFDFKQQKSTYACKTVPISRAEDILLLREECANLEAVRGHPNLLKFERTFEDGDNVHIITELLEGGELYDTIMEMTKHRTYFAEDDSAWMIRNILDGLSYCHDVTGVVHRDLKASNFMFKRKINFNVKNNKANRARLSVNLRDIKIIDFGLSTKINPKTGKVNGCLGTPYYVAPEILSEEFYDSKCDVWSVGVVAYLILSRKLPFQGKDEESTLHMLRDAENNLPKYDSMRWKKLDPLAVDFCKSLLQVDPLKRPSAREAMSHPWIVKHCGTPPPQRSRINIEQSIITMAMVDDDEVDIAPTNIGSSILGSETFDSQRTTNSSNVVLDPIPEHPPKKNLLQRFFFPSDKDNRQETISEIVVHSKTKQRRVRQKTDKTLILENSDRS